MKKCRAIIVFIVTISLLFTGCGMTSKQEKVEKVTLQVPMGPPTAPILYMQENNLLGEKVEVVIYKNMEEANVNIAKKTADLSIIPVNVASILYNKEMDISLLNVNTWGILYMVAKEGLIQSWDDLKGKEIHVGAQGASPDVLTRYLLQKNGIQEEEVTLQYSSSPEIVQKMIAGQGEVAVLPEPLLTQALKKAENIEVVYDYAKEWQGIHGEDRRLPQTGMVIQNGFAQKYPKWVQEFQKTYAEAVVKIMEDPSIVSEVVEKEMGIPQVVFEEAMTRIHLEAVHASDGKEEVQAYLEALLALSPTMIGGNVPDAEFYYKE
ncbi:MAG: ABC transporter substrate-binding protein [Epulopiscium sp.]|nr:ABC transporter substrate-binding protein [Candidatus Epulonipiscium sp.]